MRLLPPLFVLCALVPPASAFEWDDGRGAFPFRPVTTRNYEAARDLEHLRRDRGGDRLDAVSASFPPRARILRPAFPGTPEPPPGRSREAGRNFRFH
jgi:hypothetical protein